MHPNTPRTAARPRRAAALAAAIGLGLVGAACSDDAAARTPEAWTEAADAVCRAGAERVEAAFDELQGRLDRDGRPEPTGEELAHLYEVVRADVERQVAEIGELTAPGSIRDDVEAWLAAADAALARLADLGPEDLDEGEDPFAEVRARSLDLGIPSCGDAGGGDGGTAAEPAIRVAHPRDGAEVTSPVAITVDADGFTIEPAGEVRPGAGHVHVLVDVPCVTPGQPVPRDEHHLHFGGGETGVQVELAPGTHTLCVQAADGAHIALDLTDELTVEVVG